MNGPAGAAHLSPKSIEALLCLASRPLEIVERDTFMTEVWPDRSVGRDALTHCISEIRQALGDHRDQPQFIQTLPNRGYRLLVEPVIDATVGAVRRQAADDRRARWSIESFLEQLKRRRVVSTAGAYLVAGWALLQVADVVCEPLGCPAGTQRMTIIAVIAFFPVALLLAWILQWGRDPESGKFRPVREQARPLDVAILSLATVTVGALLLWLVPDRPPAAPPVAANSIAVMPFADLSPARDQDYFCKGIAEEIIHKLTRLRRLKVASRTDTFNMPAGLDIAAIATRLGVEHVLEGSVRRAGDRLRVTAQLIDTATRFHVWSQEYERELADVFSIQDDIADHVVEALHLVIRAGKETDKPANLDAYENYLKGREQLRSRSEGSLASAQAYFEAAIAEDPDYASAHAGLCETFLERYEDKLARTDFRAAKTACDDALDLGSVAGPVYVALGNLYRVSGQSRDAYRQFDKAIEVNPYDVDAYVGKARTYAKDNKLDAAAQTIAHTLAIQPQFWRGHLQMGNLLYSEGRFAEAIPYYERVAQQQPRDAAAFINLGSAHFMAGDFDSALENWRQALEIDPGRDTAHANIASSLFYARRFAEAAETYRKAIEIAPEDYTNHGMLAGALWHAGATSEAQTQYRRAAALAEGVLDVNPNDAEAASALSIFYAAIGAQERSRELIEQARRLAPKDMYTHYDAARALVLLNDFDAALKALRRAVELDYPIALIPADAALDPLRQEPGFTAIISSR